MSKVFKVMKNWPQLLLALPLLVSSCTTTDLDRAESRVFTEEAIADLVLKYSSDQTVFMLKPDGHDGAFYRVLNREQVRALDASRTGKRDLSVVVIGFNRAPAVEQQIKDSWAAMLADLKYRRVVFLRDADLDRSDGLRIIEERQLSLAGPEAMDGSRR